MQVGIIGAGIVGVTTAHEFAAQGHEVTVFERRGSVAEESSFANAGVIAPGYVMPWAAPDRPGQVFRHLMGRHAPIRLGGLGVLAQLPWLWQWWRACRPQVHEANRRAMHELARFSRERTLELTRNLNLEYDQMPGYMVLLRSGAQLAQAQAGLALLRALGVQHELIDASRARWLEPALNLAMPLHAAVHLPQDGVGNCRQFAQLLKNQAQKLGTRFQFDTPVVAVRPGQRPQVEWAGGGQQAFDAVVVCAGVQANAVLASVGLKLPLAAVHGYSITAPIRHVDGYPDPGPRTALMDARYKVAISRLGQRVRVAGLAEIGGHALKHSAAALATLYKVLDDWFPGSALVREAQHWKGARPMLPDGPPVLGASPAPGVWLNLGHGSSGWTLACGSACVLADLVSGRRPPIDLSRLGPERLRTGAD